MQPSDIDICVCTFRRASLRDTLQSLAAQNLPQGLAMRVIVTDNDETPSARPRFDEAVTEFGLCALYVHAPARNIAIARNACLDACSAPLAAFIDDDETAAPDWIASLLHAWSTSGAQVILGRVQAIYEAAPAWAARADLHSITPPRHADGSITTGYTCNALIDRTALELALQDVRFNPAFGRSGGEDTIFFHHLHQRGATLHYCDDAVVYEKVPPNRARLRWLLARAFRSGQSHARMRQRAAALHGVPVALAKILLLSVMAGWRLAIGQEWRRPVLRATLQAGIAARFVGIRESRLY